MISRGHFGQIKVVIRNGKRGSLGSRYSSASALCGLANQHINQSSLRYLRYLIITMNTFVLPTTSTLV